MQHVFGNTATQFKVFDHQRFQVGKVSSLPPPILNTLHSRQSSAMEQLCKIENRTNSILVNQSKNETATKMKVSPLQVAFTLSQVFGGCGGTSLQVGEGLLNSASQHPPHQFLYKRITSRILPSRRWRSNISRSRWLRKTYTL